MADQTKNQDVSEKAATNTGDTPRASWNFSADQLSTDLADYPPDAREILQWCFGWCVAPEHPISFDDFSARIGYASNTVYKVMRGKYTHPITGVRMAPNEKMMRALRDFRRVETSRSRYGSTEFVETPTVQKIRQACDTARESQTPVFLFGSSQIGKTWGLKDYCRRNPGRNGYACLEPASGLMGMVRTIAAAVGVSPNGNTPDLVARIKKAVSPQMLLIIDEMHVLLYTYRRESFFSCVETLRNIYDSTQCGLVMCMTNLGAQKVETERRGALEQIFRRGVHRVQLGNMPSKADITRILAAWKLEFPAKNELVEVKAGKSEFSDAPYEVLATLAKNDGLKAIVERLRYGVKLAGDNDTPLSWEHFLLANRLIAKNAALEPDWA